MQASPVVSIAESSTQEILRANPGWLTSQAEPFLEEDLKFGLLTQEQEDRDDSLQFCQLLFSEVLRSGDGALVLTGLLWCGTTVTWIACTASLAVATRWAWVARWPWLRWRSWPTRITLTPAWSRRAFAPRAASPATRQRWSIAFLTLPSIIPAIATFPVISVAPIVAVDDIPLSFHSIIGILNIVGWLSLRLLKSVIYLAIAPLWIQSELIQELPLLVLYLLHWVHLVCMKSSLCPTELISVWLTCCELPCEVHDIVLAILIVLEVLDFFSVA